MTMNCGPRLAAVVPVTDAVLEDAAGPTMNDFIVVHLSRAMVAETFGEDWSGPERERDLLEIGRVHTWDAPVHDECEED